MLSQSNAGKNLTWLDLSGFNPENLDALRNMKELRRLDCPQNQALQTKELPDSIQKIIRP